MQDSCQVLTYEGLCTPEQAGVLRAFVDGVIPIC